jgi:hypothetical protein
MSWRAVVLLAVAGCLAATGPAAAQCAMCKAVLEGAVEGRRIAEGLNKGILLMLAAPYLIFGSFLLLVFRRRLLDSAARWRAGRTAPALPPTPLPAGD